MPEVVKKRGTLKRTIEAIKNGQITIGFVGGSITDPRPRHNWPEPFAAWFIHKYPSVTVNIENAAIGATGSDLAVFRAEKDLIDRQCDIVFVEYAVNDYYIPSERRMRTREGLIRKLLSAKIDVVIVYTFRQEMYDSMLADETPDSISEFEQLAEHYCLSSVWMGLHAFNEVRQGLMRWEEWLPDGLHTQSRGSLSYAQSVIGFFEKAILETPQNEEYEIPQPLNAMNWEKTELINCNMIETKGPWMFKRWNSLMYVDQVLETTALGSELKISFSGIGVVLGQDFGNTSAEFCWRIDNSEWTNTCHARFDWIGDEGLYYIDVLNDNLEHHDHILEIKIIHGNAQGCKGTNFRLAFIGIIK